MFTKQNIFINVSKIHRISERHTALYQHIAMFFEQLKRSKPGIKVD